MQARRCAACQPVTSTRPVRGCGCTARPRRSRAGARWTPGAPRCGPPARGPQEDRTPRRRSRPAHCLPAHHRRDPLRRPQLPRRHPRSRSGARAAGARPTTRPISTCSSSPCVASTAPPATAPATCKNPVCGRRSEAASPSTSATTKPPACPKPGPPATSGTRPAHPARPPPGRTERNLRRPRPDPSPAPGSAAHRRQTLLEQPAAPPTHRRRRHRRQSLVVLGLSSLRTPPAQPATKTTPPAPTPTPRQQTSAATDEQPRDHELDRGAHHTPAPSATLSGTAARGGPLPCREPDEHHSEHSSTFAQGPASVAQGIEHRSPKAGVAGSNPAGGTERGQSRRFPPGLALRRFRGLPYACRYVHHVGAEPAAAGGCPAALASNG